MANYVTDVVVVGAGAAGLSAAVAASQNGAKVITIEKQKRTGGNGSFAAGVFGVGSTLQKNNMINADPDEFFKMAMEFSHWKSNAPLMRKLIRESGPTIEWLTALGVPFAQVKKMLVNQSPEVFHAVAGDKMPLPTGKIIMDILRDKLIENGGEILTDTEVDHLIIEDGEIKGVTTKNGDSIKAKKVIIASGGFVGDMESLNKHLHGYNIGDDFAHVGITHSGVGIKLALEGGGFVDNDVIVEGAAPKGPGGPVLSTLRECPELLWTDINGRRFADEGIVFNISYGLCAVSRLPEHRCWMVFDGNIKNQMLERFCNGAPGPFESVEKAEENLEADVAAGLVFKADSIEELAEKIGVDKDTIKKTIETYNAACDAGKDEDMCKDKSTLIKLDKAPYYACAGGIGIINTHGGIRVTPEMEVENEKGNVIKNLYAAGVDISGVDSGGYIYRLSGHSFGFSLGEGRIAGEEAAKSL